MGLRLILCASCRCHVRSGEPRCPHCGADLAATEATRNPERRRFDVRRLLCASALAGAALPGCAGQPLNEDVQGTCTLSEGAGPSIHTAAMQGSIAYNCGNNACACGTGGICKNSECVSCECAVDQTCNPDGTCTTTANYWFGQYPPNVSTCYGSPPLLA